MVGTVIGQYRIVSSIGAGGMGMVYIGEHTLIGRRAAIKVLNPELSQQREVVHRFFNEARAAAAVRHAGIVQIFDFGFSSDGHAYLVMELLEGWSLAQVLRDLGALPAVDAMHVIRQVAWSIASVHAAGIIHRDLKPDNIYVLLDPDAIGGLRVKILDFGVAKLGDAFEPSRTQAGGVFGTPLYMAPEQFVGKVDERSDVYAVGCVMFEALVGAPPFRGQTLVELGFAHTFNAPPVPSSLCTTSSPDIDATVLGCLAKDPEQRFASIAALGEAIDDNLARLSAAQPGRLRSALESLAAGRTPRMQSPGEASLSLEQSAAIRAPTGAGSEPPATAAAEAAPVSALSMAKTMVSNRAPDADPPPTSTLVDAPSPSPVEHLLPLYLPEPPQLPPTIVPVLPVFPAQGAPASARTSAVPMAPRGWTSETGTAPQISHSHELPRAPGLGEIWGPVRRVRRSATDEHQRAAREFTQVFESTVPISFRDSLGFFIKFFSELFSTARKFNDQVVQLGSPAIPDLAAREHYVLFVHDIDDVSVASFERPRIVSPAAAPGGLRALKTAAFRSSVAPLAEHLATLGSPPNSVVIAILAAPQLGQGARETIFALRKDQKLFVVPLAAAEIRRACDAGNGRLLLINRIADLHTVSDPFAVLEAFTDPTRCIGFATEVGDLVNHITAGGKIVSVAGPPGAGKTSVLAMAEYGCETASVARHFVHLPCHELVNLDPETLIRELQQRIDQLEGDRHDGGDDDRTSRPEPRTPPAATEPFSIANMRTLLVHLGARVASHDGARGSGGHPTGEVGTPRRTQLVIVLEDADWLIRLASNSEPNARLRDSAHELWRGLARLCSSGGHTVIVTSVRDFQEQVPLERHVAAARVPLRALDRRESERLVTSLGEFVGFSPTRRALAHLYRESGGNVYALRLLCSNVLRAMREQPAYSPLGRLKVTPRMVDHAAAQIAATGSTFRSHVSVWLDDIEKVVLQHVATDRPRSPRGIRRALEGTATPREIEKALDALELMGFIESKRRGHRVRIRMFERWINTQLDPPPRRQDAIKQTRMTRVAIAFTIAALLFGAHRAWLRTTRSVAAEAIGQCSFELDYPDRIGSDETFELLAYQHCNGAEQHRIAVEPMLSSVHITPASSDCAPTTASCTTSFTALTGKQAHDAYQMRMFVDGNAVVAGSVAKDRFSFWRAIGEATVPQIVWILPLLTVFAAFYKDLRRSLSQLVQLFGHGDPSTTPPTEPLDPAKVA